MEEIDAEYTIDDSRKSSSKAGLYKPIQEIHHLYLITIYLITSSILWRLVQIPYNYPLFRVPVQQAGLESWPLEVVQDCAR